MTQLNRRRRFLVVAYEFADPLFSGNGTYGRTVVEGLGMAAGDGVMIDVITAKPVDPWHSTAGLDGELQSALIDGEKQPVENCTTVIKELKIPVPASSWRRHDVLSGWREFAQGASEYLGSMVRRRCALEDERLPTSTTTDTLTRIDLYDTIVVVDWHGMVALQAMVGGWDVLHRVTTASSSSSLSLVYLNFRVFGNRTTFVPSTSSIADSSTIMAEEQQHLELTFLQSVESIAWMSSTRTVALCKADALMIEENAAHVLKQLVGEQGESEAVGQRQHHQKGDDGCDGGCWVGAALEQLQQIRPVLLWLRRTAVAPPPPGVVLPPVRSEVLASAAQLEQNERLFVETHLPQQLVVALRQHQHHQLKYNEQCGRQPNNNNEEDVDWWCEGRRRFVVCCVRQARDKNPGRFVQLIEDLTRQPHNQPHNNNNCNNGVGSFIPVVFGAAPDPEYSASLRRRLLQACPGAVWVEQFITPAQLVAIFRLTLLNVHPSLYDAYGLTVVEAAVCGCPTLLHKVSHEASSPVGVVDLLMPLPTAASSPVSSSSTAVAIEPTGATLFFADLRTCAEAPLHTPTCTSQGVALDEVNPSCFTDDEATRIVADILSPQSEERRRLVAHNAGEIAKRYDTLACGHRLLVYV